MFNKLDEYIEELEGFSLSLVKYNKKVTPILFSQDEEVFHIESKIAIEVSHNDIIKEFIFFLKERKETVGLELEIELDDFIDFDSFDPGYLDTLVAVEKYLER